MQGDWQSLCICRPFDLYVCTFFPLGQGFIRFGCRIFDVTIYPPCFYPLFNAYHPVNNQTVSNYKRQGLTRRTYLCLLGFYLVGFTGQGVIIVKSQSVVTTPLPSWARRYRVLSGRSTFLVFERDFRKQIAEAIFLQYLPHRVGQVFG